MQVDFVLKSTALKPADVLPVLAALQIQVQRDLYPTWNAWANLALVNGNRGNATIFLLDDPTQANALGYHDLAKVQPVGFVFVKLAIQYEGTWTITGSHEVIELLVDPDINSLADGLSILGRPCVAALEPADMVEGDWYVINGTKVSNWVTPAYFLPSQPAGTKTDFMGTLKGRPWPALTSGGYTSYATSIGIWQQIYGQTTAAHLIDPPPFGRRYRRIEKAVAA